MTSDEMDQLFARHCAAELANDLDSILDTLTDDVEHDVVGDPAGVLCDRGLIAKRYSEIFSSFADDSMDSRHRYHGEGFFVDESLVTSRVTGAFMGVAGSGRRVSFRIL